MRGRTVVRTIRHGRVKIGGKWFVPNEQYMEYDGRLDGMRYAFGRYRHGKDGAFEPFVSMWGTEACYRDDEQWEEADYDDPSLITTADGVGTYLWIWWDEA